MNRRFPQFRSLAIACLATLSAVAGDNLLPNGTFDEGTETAAHWEPANGLTTFFVQEPGRGRVVRLDTTVDKKQAREWAARFAKNPTLTPPTPIRGSRFGTIGANDGVALDSAFIDVVPGQDYRLTADIKGNAGVIVWIKGFMHHRGRWRDAYQTRLTGAIAPDTWKSLTIGFNPTGKTPRVTRIKVRLYAYWPSGTCTFDAIRIEAITPEQMAALVEARARK